MIGNSQSTLTRNSSVRIVVDVVDTGASKIVHFHSNTCVRNLCYIDINVAGRSKKFQFPGVTFL